jgi:hypothetical protein
MWNLSQQAAYKQQGLWPTQGALPPDTFVEGVFSSYLYTPSTSNVPITINNGINLSANGGMVWFKNRSTGGSIGYNCLVDTVRGGTNLIHSNDVTPAYTANIITAFNSNGFTTGISSFVTRSPDKMVGWTFQKKAKFFDIVTWSGNGVAGREIPHNLGSTPGCIIIKCLNAETNWSTWHRGTATDQVFFLNTSDASSAEGDFYATAPTSTVFTVNSFGRVNGSGFNYVAYVFAHNAGGFGLSGTENVISCGSTTTDGSGNFSATLNYEPQWVLVKSVSSSRWDIFDNMRGVSATSGYISAQRLNANLADAEDTMSSPYGLSVNATGFAGNIAQGFGSNLIYIAIRRGPMAVPTLGTSVFMPQVVAESTTAPNFTNTITSGFPVDWVFTTTSSSSRRWGARLIGNAAMQSNSTANESNFGIQATVFDSNTSAGIVGTLGSAASAFMYAFKRAPTVFDVVCWTGDSTNPRSINHNLTVAPTLIITKKRNSNSNWITGYDFTSTTYKYFFFNDSGAANSDTYASTPVYGGNPTSSVFIVGNQGNMNISGDTYVSLLFSTCAGVSKFGTYTGTGATQIINCDFASGARFVLIKSTSTTGDWLVWDSARGIVAGDDPYFAFNNTTAQVTNTDWVDTAASGFELSNTGGNLANSNGVGYIFLAFA